MEVVLILLLMVLEVLIVVNGIDFIRRVNDVNTGVDLNGFNGVGGVDPDSTLVTI